jgi:hypothetical protein
MLNKSVIMKRFVMVISIGWLMCACNREKKQIVPNDLIDSLLIHYTDPEIAKSTEYELEFWKSRINPQLPGIVSESKYAGFLALRFHLFGDIKDIKTADSVIRKEDLDFNHKEAPANLTLEGYSILQHRFKDAELYRQKARQIGLKKYDLLISSFDVDFELGKYSDAANELSQFKSSDDYGYFFRRSKMDHLHGKLDSSLHAMLKAASLAGTNNYLKQVALANAGDLYIHEGDLQKAAELYIRCIHINCADFHSLLGLGWIAFVHDKNDVLAEKIFRFVLGKNKLPDPLFKLTQLAEQCNNIKLEKRYASDFEMQATDSVYGDMYNKYLIELYTSVLNDPARAELISKRELNNRATPQTYCWYAWSLFSNNKKKEAYEVFQQYVSGRPLEGLELYWMGKMMQGLNKGYNAQQFFKAAYKNKYDLSPCIKDDLEKNID